MTLVPAPCPPHVRLFAVTACPPHWAAGCLCSIPLSPGLAWGTGDLALLMRPLSLHGAHSPVKIAGSRMVQRTQTARGACSGLDRCLQVNKGAGESGSVWVRRIADDGTWLSGEEADPHGWSKCVWVCVHTYVVFLF